MEDYLLPCQLVSGTNQNFDTYGSDAATTIDQSSAARVSAAVEAIRGGCYVRGDY